MSEEMARLGMVARLSAGLAIHPSSKRLGFGLAAMHERVVVGVGTRELLGVGAFVSM